MQNLVTALVKARQKFQAISKDKVNPHYKSRYATLDSVLEAVNPGLLENGLAVVQATDIVDNQPVLKTILLHVSGEQISSTYPLPQNLSDPQKLGAALTYARRYALCALLSVAADEDDDGNSASGVSETRDRPPSQQARSQSQPQANNRVISDGQRKRLYAIAKEAGYSDEGFKAMIQSQGFESSKDIAPGKYDAICEIAQNPQGANHFNAQATQQAA